MTAPAAVPACLACGDPAEAGPLTRCSCGAALHLDCLRYSLCPQCPPPESTLPLPATPHLRRRRTLAMALDAGFLLAPSLVAMAGGVVAGLYGLPLFFLGSAAAVGADVFNKGLLQGEGGATWGKKALGLRLVDDRGRRLGWKRALAREFVRVPWRRPPPEQAFLLEA